MRTHNSLDPSLLYTFAIGAPSQHHERASFQFHNASDFKIWLAGHVHFSSEQLDLSPYMLVAATTCERVEV